jgi:hypothetical protein
MRAFYLLDRLDLSVNSTEITVKIQNCDIKLTHFFTSRKTCIHNEVAFCWCVTLLSLVTTHQSKRTISEYHNRDTHCCESLKFRVQSYNTILRKQLREK